MVYPHPVATVNEITVTRTASVALVERSEEAPVKLINRTALS